ncbi:nucleotidyltransferase domain-containing protein [Niallia sp. XMNu-256]|uniref:nucleotidyltransferase domain-containing protein n=1 Tax=Niallia sp. XMNu-256 TaxID=3082444 RepID=UPI0030D4E451
MIQSWLTEIQERYEIDILFAVEAGSRAWGEATSQSDHDIRFIFKARDIKKYVSLEKALETLDFPEPYDAVGWDLFKALHLLEKSNYSLLEWVRSPIVYQDHHYFSDKLKTLIQESYSLFTLYQHYIRLMARNIKDVRSKEFSDKRQKQMIHAVRSYLLAKEIIVNRRIPFDGLYCNLQANTVENRMALFYDQLIAAKKMGRVLNNKYGIEEIITIMEKERTILDQAAIKLPRGKRITTELNQWIWELLDL